MGGKALKNLRKKLLINEKFQLSYLKYTCGIAMVIFSVFFISYRFFFWKYSMKGIDAGLPTNHLFFRILEEQKVMMDLVFVVTAVLIFSFLIVYGLYLSNKIAGPIHRLEKFLKKNLDEPAQGNIKFRQEDYFRELENPINQIIARRSK